MKSYTKIRFARLTRRNVLPFLAVLAVAAIFCSAFIFTAVGSASMAYLFLLPGGALQSGKADSTVYQRNGRARNFIMPPYRNTAATQAVRTRLGGLSSAWRNLTPSQVDSWLGISITTVNTLGKVITSKGKTAFVTLNSALMNISVPANVNAPVLTGQIAPVLGTPVIDVSATSLNPAATNTDADYGIIVKATGPTTPGRKSRPSDFKQIYAIADSSTLVDTDIWDAYVNVFGYALTVGDVIEMQVSYVNNITGEQSPYNNTGRVIVVA